jgi:GT2 family glycosyltransferase
MIQIPFSFEKDLGKAYNTAMAKVTDEYAIIMDYDAMILTPNTLPLVDRYVKTYPEAALLTGYASRAHPSSSQKYPVMNNGDVLRAINIAEKLEVRAMSVKKIEKNLTGFFMVIKRSTWEKYKFKEGIGCLGVDTDYWQQLIAAGETILLMETVFVWHTYRLKNGIKNKEHLII